MNPIRLPKEFGEGRHPTVYLCVISVDKDGNSDLRVVFDDIAEAKGNAMIIPELDR
jgi:hypothetical protein